MASNNNNNTKNQQQKNEAKKKGSGWLLPGIVGVALGAGLAYIFGKSQSKNSSEEK